MTLFMFGAIVAIVGVVAGVYLGGYLTERGAKKADTQQAATAAAATAATPPTDDQGEKRRLWFASQNKSDHALQFQKWASANFQDGELRTWITGLSKEQMSALSEQLSTFCTSLGFNLDWLINQQLGSNEDLKPTAMDIVEHYCTACFQATSVQSAFVQFKEVMDLIEQPFTREHKAITQKLYADLVQRSVVSAMTPDLMMANEQARQEYIARVLKEAVSSNWDIFSVAFEAAVKTEHGEKKSAWNTIVRNRFSKKKDAAANEGSASVAAANSTQEQAA